MKTGKMKCESNTSNQSKDYSFSLDEGFKNENPYTEEQREALRQKALSDGKIIDPIIIWKGMDVLVWGYEEFEIAQEHNLAYETKEIDFESKADCLAWIGEKRLAIPTLTLFQKIEIGNRWWEYWRDKDEAKHGKESPLRKAALERFGRADKLAIIALKAGTSHNTVNKVNRILDTGNMDTIKQCRKEEIAIDTAYKLIENDSREDEAGKGVVDEMSEAENKKASRKQKQRQEEINSLARYYVDGFYSANTKLDDHGLKFFILRWNEENPDNQINGSEVQQAIDNIG